MKIQGIQKVIKVGSSLAVTIPARDAKVLGIQAGDNIISTYETLKPETNGNTQHIASEYQAFKRQYDQTLKNLAGR